jgi:Fur family transcriptional regulator, ferric uptake regulator
MEFLQKLKTQGFRLTKPREDIIKVLKGYPHTVLEIFEELKHRGCTVDLASVYRSLDLFEKMNLVQVIELGEGRKRYELISEGHHHHHLVCDKCGTIEDVEIKEEMILNEVSKKTHFKIQKHTLEFFGLCINCQH